MIVAVPPEPVASLRRVKRPAGASRGIVGALTAGQQARRLHAPLGRRLPRPRQVLPPLVLLGVPDPDAVIGVDPGTRMNVPDGAPLRHPRQHLGKGG